MPKWIKPFGFAREELRWTDDDSNSNLGEDLWLIVLVALILLDLVILPLAILCIGINRESNG